MAKGIANRNTARYNLEPQYIVFFNSNFNLSWNWSTIDRFQEMWNAGLSEREIAKKFGCHIWELTMFGMCLTEQNLIERRPKGFFGLQATIND